MAIARTGRFSDYLVLPWLDSVVALGDLWFALFSVDPYTVGTPADAEVSGGLYARAGSPVSRSGRLLRNTQDLLWAGLSGGTSIVSLGAFDAPFGGNFLLAGPIPASPITLVDGGYFTQPALGVQMGINA